MHCIQSQCILYFSIDSSGCHDLFLGYTDRAVGAHRWDNSVNSLVAITDRLPLAGQVGFMNEQWWECQVVCMLYTVDPL